MTENTWLSTTLHWRKWILIWYKAEIASEERWFLVLFGVNFSRISSILVLSIYISSKIVRKQAYLVFQTLVKGKRFLKRAVYVYASVRCFLCEFQKGITGSCLLNFKILWSFLWYRIGFTTFFNVFFSMWFLAKNTDFVVVFGVVFFVSCNSRAFV